MHQDVARDVGLRVHMRWMIRRDMPEVLAIEAASYDFPWDEEQLLSTLRHRNVIGMVAEVGDRVVGFMVYELFKGFISVLDLAVRPDLRRRGVGGQMTARLFTKLSRHRRTALKLNVRETNLGGQLFLRSQGFLAEGVERDFFPDSGEDSFLMGYTLQEPS